MGVTPGGLPFMDDYDPLADVAQRMEALALAVEAQLGYKAAMPDVVDYLASKRQVGAVTTGTHTVNVTLSTPVEFPTPFPDTVTPVIFLTVQALVNPTITVVANNVTHLGFSIQSMRTAGTPGCVVAWEAVDIT